MDAHIPLNIAVIDESLNDVEMYGKLIKDLGYSINITRLEDCEDLEDAFKEQQCLDLLLFSFEFQYTTIKQIRTCLNKYNKDISIVCLFEEKSDITLEQALNDGATSLVNKDNIVHFKQTMQRELDFAITRKKLDDIYQRYLESEKRCQVLMASSKDAIAYVHDGMHVTANDAYLELFGFKQFDEIEGTPIMDMVSDDEQEKFKTFLRTINKDHFKSTEVEIDLINAKGKVFNAKMEFSPATIDGEACTQIIIRDQSDSKELEKQLALLSKTDQLTGLFNRRYLIQNLEKKIKTAKENPFSFFYLAIDQYDKLSEELGVLGSDQMIASVAKTLKQVLPQKQLLCRFTGHTYCIILQHYKKDMIEKVAKALIDAVNKQTLNYSGKVVNPTISIGICLVDESIKATSDALNRAEKALESATKTGHSQYKIYQPKQGELTQTQLDEKWKSYLAQALKEKRFSPRYQPIVSLSGDPVHRYEVTALLFDEHGEQMDADEYTEVANRTGVAKSIDRWLILSTLQTIIKTNKGKQSFAYFISLSNATLEDPSLFRWLNDQMKKFRIPPNSLIFSVNSDTALSRLKQTRALVVALQKLKCEFSLSNFGSGPNPFQIIKHIPLDYVKIHPDFVKNLTANTENQQSIKQMADKATKLRKKIIVGDIDDPGSLTVLWGLGAHLVQGDFISPPAEKTDYDFNSLMM